MLADFVEDLLKLVNFEHGFHFSRELLPWVDQFLNEVLQCELVAISDVTGESLVSHCLAEVDNH